MRCKRVENPAWGTVEFIDESAPDNDANKSCSAPSRGTLLTEHVSESPKGRLSFTIH